MRINDVLEELEKLFRKWEVEPDYWILVAGYAYRLLGYDIKVRSGHFNILVPREKIPWTIKEGIEIHPPRGTLYRKDFKKFVQSTGFDFDINLATLLEFKKKRSDYVIYKLPNNRKIKVQKPVGALRELRKLLKLSTKEGLGSERLQKDIVFIENMIHILIKKGQVQDANKFKSLLQVYKKIQKKVADKRSSTESNVIQGIVASSGRGVGLVKVVNKPKDVGGVKKGSILITQMTSPTLTAFLPKISAIVTDWGGMLCHAAILAREMGVPCIVGTQNATKVLKDGDLVEADADNGVVRKLER